LATSNLCAAPERRLEAVSSDEKEPECPRCAKKKAGAKRYRNRQGKVSGFCDVGLKSVLRAITKLVLHTVR